MKKLFLIGLIFLAGGFSPAVSADCMEDCVAKAACPKFQAGKDVVCEDPQPKCEEECKAQADEDDVMFTGTKITHGNTTIMQGERIAAPLSAFQGGHLRPEDLEPFRKNVISSTNAEGSVSVSTSSGQHGWFTGSHSSQTQSTDLSSGLTVTTREKKE